MDLSRGRAIVGGILILVGGIWLLDAAEVIDFPLRALAPLSLIAVGIGLVVGSRHGSYPLLIAVGVALTVFLAIGTTDDRDFGRDFDRDSAFGTGVGSTLERPREAFQLRPYRIQTGRLTVDLTRLRLRERTYDVSARVGAGQLVVIVPEGVPMRVRARTGVGNVEIPGDRSSGFGADQDFEAPGFDDARPRFDLELRVGVGSIRVSQGRRVPVEVETDVD